MTAKDPRRGCVHGRFQPPHSDHLSYIEAALRECDTLIIGITQPNTKALDDCRVDPHRAIPSENPLTYEQRCECIRDMLDAQKIDRARYTFMPFRIDMVQELVKVLSKDVICYTTICNSWNLEKIDILKSNGYQVEVLWDKRGQAVIEGSEIRRRIRLGDASWKGLVHPAVAAKLESMGVLQKIASGA